MMWVKSSSEPDTVTGLEYILCQRAVLTDQKSKLSAGWLAQERQLVGRVTMS